MIVKKKGTYIHGRRKGWEGGSKVGHLSRISHLKFTLKKLLYGNRICYR